MISLAYAMVALAWLAIFCTFKGEIAARPHHLGSAQVGDAHQGEIRYVIPETSAKQYKQQQHYMVTNC